MKILSLDPGKRTGWAVLDSRLKLHVVKFGTINYEDLKGFFDHFTDIDVVIYEDYITDPKIKQGGSTGEALKVIGRVQAWAEDWSIPVIKQSRSIKPAAYAFAGLTYRKGAKNAHHTDAIAHGYYFLVKHGHLKAGWFLKR